MKCALRYDDLNLFRFIYTPGLPALWDTFWVTQGTLFGHHFKNKFCVPFCPVKLATLVKCPKKALRKLVREVPKISVSWTHIRV